MVRDHFDGWFQPDPCEECGLHPIKCRCAESYPTISYTDLVAVATSDRPGDPAMPIDDPTDDPRPPTGTPGWCERCDDWIDNVEQSRCTDEQHQQNHREDDRERDEERRLERGEW